MGSIPIPSSSAYILFGQGKRNAFGGRRYFFLGYFPHNSSNNVINMIQGALLQGLLIIVNCVALIVFGVDKLQSKRGGWRVPESRLLLLAFFGPFGAYAGMLLFRHKIRKIKFLLVPIFLVIQVVLIAYFYLIK
jgi:uncharacterized membrane protein YsdA (DUF1294 family)